MTPPTLLQLVPAFTLGCILTEIRWIVRMRKLRGQAGSNEITGAPSDPRVLLGNAEAFDPEESLRNLSQQLAAEAPVSRLRERPAATKS